MERGSKMQHTCVEVTTTTSIVRITPRYLLRLLETECLELTRAPLDGRAVVTIRGPAKDGKPKQVMRVEQDDELAIEWDDGGKQIA